eukprot:SAG31_NODE_1032_length_10231_cov_3.718417_4_plen_909_part_00
MEVMNRSLMEELRQQKQTAAGLAEQNVTLGHEVRKANRDKDETQAELDTLRFRKQDERGAGGSGSQVTWSDHRAAMYFEQERMVSHMRDEKVKMKRKIMVLEGQVKALTAKEGSKGGGWDLAVERGKKLSNAEKQVASLTSRLKLADQRWSQMKIAVEKHSNADKKLRCAEDNVRNCLKDAEQRVGGSSLVRTAEPGPSPTAGSPPRAKPQQEAPPAGPLVTKLGRNGAGETNRSHMRLGNLQKVETESLRAEVDKLTATITSLKKQKRTNAVVMEQLDRKLAVANKANEALKNERDELQKVNTEYRLKLASATSSAAADNGNANDDAAALRRKLDALEMQVKTSESRTVAFERRAEIDQKAADTRVREAEFNEQVAMTKLSEANNKIHLLQRELANMTPVSVEPKAKSLPERKSPAAELESDGQVRDDKVCTHTVSMEAPQSESPLLSEEADSTRAGVMDEHAEPHDRPRDSEESNTLGDDDQIAAATKIQANYRGAAERKQQRNCGADAPHSGAADDVSVDAPSSSSDHGVLLSVAESKSSTKHMDETESHSTKNADGRQIVDEFFERASKFASDDHLVSFAELVAVFEVELATSAELRAWVTTATTNDNLDHPNWLRENDVLFRWSNEWYRSVRAVACTLGDPVGPLLPEAEADLTPDLREGLIARFEQKKKERFEGEQHRFWNRALLAFTEMDGGSGMLNQLQFHALCHELFSTLGPIENMPWASAIGATHLQTHETAATGSAQGQQSMAQPAVNREYMSDKLASTTGIGGTNSGSKELLVSVAQSSYASLQAEYEDMQDELSGEERALFSGELEALHDQIEDEKSRDAARVEETGRSRSPESVVAESFLHHTLASVASKVLDESESGQANEDGGEAFTRADGQSQGVAASGGASDNKDEGSSS